jgi:ATP-dependent Clp protease adapter protein ClpS
VPVCNYDIRIKNKEGKVLYFDYVVDCEITSTWQELTNTCKFTLPRRVGKLLTETLDRIIQVGNEVVIKAGYNDTLHTYFTGYITEIGAAAPLEIKCEDAMWKLKQITVAKAYKSVTLSKLLADIMPAEIAYKAVSRQLGGLRYSKVTVAQILKDLKEHQGVHSYIRNGKLYCGWAYDTDMVGEDYKVNLHFEKNIFNNALVYKRKEDVKLRVDAISMHSNGKDVKYSYPAENAEGEVHTLHSYGKELKDVKEDAKAKHAEMVFDGYRGSFTTFGHPFIDHGFVVHVTSNIYPERDGKYYADKVVYRIGNVGIKQDVTLGGKAKA